MRVLQRTGHDFSGPSQTLPRQMKASTSLTVAEFEALGRQFAPLWAGLLAEQTAEGTSRQRQPGGGRKGTLAMAKVKLFLILFYYQDHPTHDVTGLIFSFTQGQVSAWVSRLTAAGRAFGCSV